MTNWVLELEKTIGFVLSMQEVKPRFPANRALLTEAKNWRKFAGTTLVLPSPERLINFYPQKVDLVILTLSKCAGRSSPHTHRSRMLIKDTSGL